MSEIYPILEVQPEWVVDPEFMGSKEKFWYRQPGEDERNWLFKYPRKDTGEHWAEKIAAEVARLLGIPHGRVELSEYQGTRGSSAESFARDDQDLFHGNQLLARTVRSYDPATRLRQSNHTLENIWRALDSVFEAPEAAERAKRQFAEYLVLDAVIGNTDRHHENWGVLWRWARNRRLGLLAPSFDHASSLGRELLDEARNRLLAEDRVGNYAERGIGGIYWSEYHQRGPNPLELVQLAAHAYPDLLCPALVKLEKLDTNSFREVVNRVPDDWMSPSARNFATELMWFNYSKVIEITQ